jgi:putative ABC transport system ATP-binding protein/macrolide transport system ATP-binding/permease protein/lipoprotein-releasing system ATP-binding protein
MMLEAHNVHKVFPTERGDVVAVRDISLSIHDGEFIAIAGRSGSGKSTLLAMLGGLCRPTSGTISFQGTDLWSLPEAARAEFRARQIGLIFQFPGLLPSLSVIDNVALPTLLTKNGTDADAYDRAARLLDRVGLRARKTAYPAELSGGEQRRAALARAIVTAPPMILADEPTSDLDQATAAEIFDLLAEIHRRDGTALVVVTHDPEVIQRADRVVPICDGSIVEFCGVKRPTYVDQNPDRRLAEFRTQIPAAQAEAPQAHEPRQTASLGAGLAPWLLSIGAWLLPAVFLGLALNQGVALYQRHLLVQRSAAKAALEDTALLWLQAAIDDISYGPGQSYTLTLALVNQSPERAIFAMSPSVRAYVQVGIAWQEIPIKPADGQEGHVSRIDSKHQYHYIFDANVRDFTEQLSGYMHVRFNYATLVSERNEPGEDLIERIDNDYVHLKPQGADDQAILRKTRFPGKPPIWIPMPPH